MHTKGKVEYTCRDCNEVVWVKSVTEMLADLRLCPQCYTLRAQDGSRKDRAQLIVKAADGMPIEEAVRYIEHGREMVDWVNWSIKLLQSTMMHPEQRARMQSLIANMKLEGK